MNEAAGDPQSSHVGGIRKHGLARMSIHTSSIIVTVFAFLLLRLFYFNLLHRFFVQLLLIWVLRGAFRGILAGRIPPRRSMEYRLRAGGASLRASATFFKQNWLMLFLSLVPCFSYLSRVERGAGKRGGRDAGTQRGKYPDHPGIKFYTQRE